LIFTWFIAITLYRTISLDPLTFVPAIALDGNAICFLLD